MRTHNTYAHEISKYIRIVDHCDWGKQDLLFFPLAAKGRFVWTRNPPECCILLGGPLDAEQNFK